MELGVDLWPTEELLVVTGAVELCLARPLPSKPTPSMLLFCSQVTSYEIPKQTNKRKNEKIHRETGRLYPGRQIQAQVVDETAQW